MGLGEVLMELGAGKLLLPLGLNEADGAVGKTQRRGRCVKPIATCRKK